MNEKSICILGAGPAGIVTALKLKQLGYNPIVLDCKKTAGNNFVQSLSPGVFSLLETVGIGLNEFHESCSPIVRSLKFWNGEIIAVESPPGFLTERDQFDLSLQKIAKRKEIRLMADTRVINLKQTDEGWEISLHQDEEYKIFKTGFLVDASGKKSIIRGVKKRVAAAMLAISGYWDNTGLEKNSTILESGSNYWLWGATLPDGIFHATLFIDPELSRIPGGGAIVRMYKYYLGRTQMFKDCLRGKLRDKLIANDVTPFYYEEPSGINYIKVGESSVGLDPISSQGIQSSMAAAIQAAIVMNTILSNPNQANLAIEFYKARCQELVRSHLQKISKVYTEAHPWKKNPFWAKRIIPIHLTESHPEPAFWNSLREVEFSPEAALIPTGCIIGNQVTSRAGLAHPMLERPIVFWEEREIGSILVTLHGRQEPSAWIKQWSDKINHVSASTLFHQLKKTGVMVDASILISD